jgi:hypothetical protein
MTKKALKVGVGWEGTDYSNKNEQLVLIHLPVFKGDIQATVSECITEDDIYFKASIPIKNKPPLEGRFPDKISAKAWVETQLGVTEDRTQELEEEVARLKVENESHVKPIQGGIQEIRNLDAKVAELERENKKLKIKITISKERLKGIKDELG